MRCDIAATLQTGAATTNAPAAPIACTLTRGDFTERLAWIAGLTRDALRGYERRGLTLDLRFAPEAVGRVREMVRREQVCCSFLAFEVTETPDDVRVRIAVPEAARESATMLLAPFLGDTQFGTGLPDHS